jgi:hypothetical protein
VLTITPHLTHAIVLAQTRSTAPHLRAAAANASTPAAGALTILALILGLIFVAAAARAIRDLAGVLAQLVRSAVTIGSALVVIAGVAIALIALLIHHLNAGS